MLSHGRRAVGFPLGTVIRGSWRVRVVSDQEIFAVVKGNAMIGALNMPLKHCYNLPDLLVCPGRR